MEHQRNKKAKYNIIDYIKQGKHRKIIGEGINADANQLHCVCRKSEIGKRLKCIRCNEQTHECLTGNNEANEKFECLRCISRKMDPLYTIKRCLLETFIKTQNIFENENSISMNFYIELEDLKYPVQVRGLLPDKKVLTWPMQGSFYINNENNPIYDLKPLLFNSNRKNRKQQYFHIPKQKLRIGKNTLTFRIPCLTEKFSSDYQSEKRGVYFIAIYSILKLSKNELVSQTIKNKQTRVQKNQSFKILQQTFIDDDLQIDGIKICLNCPYTGLRIRIPVRGKSCQHFSCVCLQTLIQTHQRLRLWNCPVCKQRLNQPKVDIWILQILNDNQSGTQVRFSLNGTYEWIAEEQSFAQISDSGEQQQKKVEDKNKKIIQPKINMIDFIDDITSQKKEKNLINGQKVIIDLDDDDNAPAQLSFAVQATSISKTISVKNNLTEIIKFPLPQCKNNKEKLNQNHQKLKNELKKRPGQAKKRNALPIKQPQIRNDAIIYDIKNLEFKQIGYSQFKNKYFKAVPKPKIPQELRKIFKDIL